jgi:hypothetical protein
MMQRSPHRDQAETVEQARGEADVMSQHVLTKETDTGKG